MSGNNNSTGELLAFIQKVWGGVVFVFAVVSAVLNYIQLAEGNSSSFTWVLFSVSIFLLFLIFVFYSFFWKPELKDGDRQEDKSSPELILPNSPKPVTTQPEQEQLRKVRFRKRVRLLARLGLVLIPILVWAGFKIHRYHAELPPEDFIILVADFEGAGSQDYLVTQEIFQNLEREMESYDKVKVEKLDKSLTSIKAARQEGEQKKAAIVIWGRYQVIDKIVPIKVYFEILKDSSEFPDLKEEVRGETQRVDIVQLNSFDFQTSLSQEMNYLSLFTLGMYRYVDEDWDRAIEYFNEALNELENPEEVMSSLGKEAVYYYLGNSFFYNLDYKEVLVSYDKALKFKPDLHQAWYNRGVALGELGRYEEAIASYDKALKFKPDKDNAWNNRGVDLGELGRYEEAIDSYDKALEFKPDNNSAWNNRGNALGDLGRYEEAIASYDKALKFKPDLHQAWNNRGVDLGELGRYEEAIDSYDKALKFKPDDHEAWYNRGNALGDLGRYEEAIDSYDKALEFKPDDHEAWNNRGIALGLLGRYEEAIDSYDKALEFKPYDDDAWYNKAATYALQNNVDLALKNLEQAIRLNPELREYAKNDSVFDTIREDERFKKLIEEK